MRIKLGLDLHKTSTQPNTVVIAPDASLPDREAAITTSTAKKLDLDSQSGSDDTRILRKSGKLFVVILSMLICVLPMSVHAERPERMLITEVKLGGQVSGQPTEFVTIHNDSSQSINLDSWLLEYAKPATKITNCQSLSWKQQDSSASIKEFPLSGVINPYQSQSFELSLNDNVGGSLKLSNAQIIWDIVGWGNSVSQGVCKENEPAPLPANTKSIKRYISNNEQFIDTNNNKLDFTDGLENIIDVLPEISSNSQVDVCSNLDETQTTVPTGYQVVDGVCSQFTTLPSENCKGIILSEILPNPAGTDTGNEYIELDNTTNSSINLSGCSIKVGNSIKQLSGLMAPGQQAFYGIVLPNANGGTVEFITNTSEEAVTYPPNLKDNQAWALIGGQWQLTETPTPGAKNIAYVITDEDNTPTTSSNTYSPCPEGKYRNPETNRCKTIEVDTAVKPCDPGQTRNPETNRCKKTSVELVSLKPCQVGQERNPATNRCRKIVTTTLASCKEGQERNAETNRCRKVASLATSSAGGTSDQTSKSKQNINYWVFVAMAILVLGYGIYEYRANLINLFNKAKKQ